ncbi:branched-chain amino acid transport system permease protein [Paenochrobactrum gallinarii]|uniref:Branched-chain amino acid transport system permease protein n=1 Tax=Paenochrobactrum gallinarii TaxID=643673 RepID=A0A841M158_9HYPH|nr:branched-chain amino acid ABC transporter permease [Paenochrobactrum gallinarii]MBB6262487.1 branched-chain amino acid transport system permease protein [Paenochrobactrum gallinarii]
MRRLVSPVVLANMAVVALLFLLPLLVSSFWIGNIFGRSLAYGIVALSLTFLATYGGFVSLAQTMVAGVAGYVLAIYAPTAIPLGNYPLPWGVGIILALVAATFAGLLVGLIAVKTNDIYLLMITLALAVGFGLFAQSNTEIFNGYEGIRNIVGPELFGSSIRSPKTFYYIALTVALILYFLVVYLRKSPFGLVLQGLRDTARRVSALGYHATAHRVAAFGVAGFIAGCGGVLVTFYNMGITASSIGMGATVNVLIMCVIGGLVHPAGAFIGALLFSLLDTFAPSIYDRDRFNTLIGFVFLAVVLLSPNGVLGVMKLIRDRLDFRRHNN